MSEPRTLPTREEARLHILNWNAGQLATPDEMAAYDEAMVAVTQAYADGRLVPVSVDDLDYGAAWDAFVANEEHEPTECACICNHNTEQAVQMAVRAALGGTDHE